jgi:hypothetical protein
MTQLSDLRKSYERAELSEEASHADPGEQFSKWLAEAIAAQVPEPNAMTLATVDKRMRPSTRVVLIKGFDAQGITWFSNYESRKGRELAANPWAALQFHWVELERVVRIEGRVDKIGEAESDAYFASRPARLKNRRLGQPAKPGYFQPRGAGRPTPLAMAPSFCCSRRARRTGAATACKRIAGSSGKGARAAYTTACATGLGVISNGFASDSLPDYRGAEI